jgi:hypothetical protein
MSNMSSSRTHMPILLSFPNLWSLNFFLFAIYQRFSKVMGFSRQNKISFYKLMQKERRSIRSLHYIYCGANRNLKVTPARVVVIGKDVDNTGIL